MAHKATTKVGTASKAGMSQQIKPTNSGNETPEKILEKKEQQLHYALVELVSPHIQVLMTLCCKQISTTMQNPI
eukprot:12051668-Ditylum_brightwellii.AAC.1